MLCKRVFINTVELVKTMENDDKIKILSNELLKGAKMLSNHCPKCGYPLFEKDGEIYCPICKRFKNNEEGKKNIEDKKHKKYKDNAQMPDLENILVEKINYLSFKLKEEEEVSRIKEIAEAIYMLVKVLKKIK